MPLDSTRVLHKWMKNREESSEDMATAPDKHDLLGFPGTDLEHPKHYTRKLWLVAEDDRKLYPKFIDEEVIKLASHVNTVVNTYVKEEEKRSGDDFLKQEAVHILKTLGFGQRIWGDGSGAETRLKSNVPGERPRWGVHTDSGYKSNDEDR